MKVPYAVVVALDLGAHPYVFTWNADTGCHSDLSARCESFDDAITMRDALNRQAADRAAIAEMEEGLET
jgi:hypothetical protein